MTTLAKAKDHFQHDLLSGYQIVRIMGAVIVQLEYRDRATALNLVDSRTKETRQFKTIDAAVRAVEEIGFTVSALFSPR